ncbi:MAG: metal-dependent phosphohydrolase, partial [Parafilimonas terrae]|nr:metal-dependent phosphohydrolase [Parafilimonas terrae]
HDIVDAGRVIRAIELTRFPVPEDDEHRETGTEAGLLRAADLIGQLGDPLYPRKLNALFHEFAEAGLNGELRYESPADLAERYPAFFWDKVEPVIGDAAGFLNLTVEGRVWMANLYAHVFAVEHDRRRMGPHPG